MTEFKDRLREIRKKNNISQAKLGEFLNYRYSTISNYESGRNEPSYDDLIKIAKFFDVSADYLLGLTARKKYIEPEVVMAKVKEMESTTKTLLKQFEEIRKLMEVQESDSLHVH